jgi:hypothetical protein
MAMMSGVLPSGAASSTLAPASSRIAAEMRSPQRAANSSGVKPPADRAFTSAPAATSVRTTSPCPSEIASISAVGFDPVSFAFGSAPCASSSFTTPAFPALANRHSADDAPAGGSTQQVIPQSALR